MVLLLTFWQRKIRAACQSVTLYSSPSKGMGKTVWFSYFRAVGFQYSKSLRGVQSGTILVAKSHKTAVYQGAAVTHLEVGGPYQATGGMGDTLAGMVAGFLAQFALN